MARPRKYSPELRERAVRLVQEQTAEHGSQWAAIRSVGETLGYSVEALHRWACQRTAPAQRAVRQDMKNGDPPFVREEFDRLS